MDLEVCNCHVNGFTHWRYKDLRNRYDLGRKIYFNLHGGSEPNLILYVSVWQVKDGSDYKGSLSIYLSRTRWAETKGIDAARATEELRAADNDLDSELAGVLTRAAEREIETRLAAYENNGKLDLNATYV